MYTGSETEGFGCSPLKTWLMTVSAMLPLHHWFLSSYSWLASQQMLGTDQKFSSLLDQETFMNLASRFQ